MEELASGWYQADGCRFRGKVRQILVSYLGKVPSGACWFACLVAVRFEQITF